MSDYRSYEYDEKSQLTRENNATTNKTTVWTYDTLGNITSKSVYPYTTGALGTAEQTVNYTYSNDGKSGWNHLLTGVGNETITYDEIGNPTQYLGASLTWFGRKLQTYEKGDKTVSYTYDANGMRASKTVNGVKTEYLYLDGALRYEKRGINELYYVYDANGHLGNIKWYQNGEIKLNIYVLTNAQGDVIGLYDYKGELQVSYEYDAWGNLVNVTDITSGNWSKLNPFRYRGYYFDEDTGLYYLGSRYYNPEVGRFLNADGYISTGQDITGFNMFTYCGNNPVMRYDPTGTFWKEMWSAFTQAISSSSAAFACAAGVALTDSPAIGPADVVALGICAAVVIGCAATATYTAIKTPTIAIPKVDEKAEAIPAPPQTGTKIYRYGGTNPGNLTPSQRDVDFYKTTGMGLSFSTTPRPGAAVTTIEAINATGVVYAVCDSVGHVSVHPIGGTLEDWYNAGSSSIWTQAVKSVVIKWDGMS